MSEQKLLIKYQADYADEFDVYGFFVETESDWEEHLKEAEEVIKNRDEPYEAGFGTNEAIVYEDFGDYERCFTVSKITDEEYEVLSNLFDPPPRYSDRVRFGFGHVLLIEE